MKKMDDMLYGENEDGWIPDILGMSSEVLCEIFSDVGVDRSWMETPHYENFFGAKAIGAASIQKIVDAYLYSPESFTVDMKRNTLVYAPKETDGRELNRILDEPPPYLLGERQDKKILFKDLARCREFFNIDFTMKWWEFWKR